MINHTLNSLRQNVRASTSRGQRWEIDYSSFEAARNLIFFGRPSSSRTISRPPTAASINTQRTQPHIPIPVEMPDSEIVRIDRVLQRMEYDRIFGSSSTSLKDPLHIIGESGIVINNPVTSVLYTDDSEIASVDYEDPIEVATIHPLLKPKENIVNSIDSKEGQWGTLNINSNKLLILRVSSLIEDKENPLLENCKKVFTNADLEFESYEKINYNEHVYRYKISREYKRKNVQ